MVKIAPSILSADFSRLGEEIKKVEDGGADLIHVDVMDGHFVPNLTMGSVILQWIKPYSKLPFDCHLMVTNPESYFESFEKAGADSISFHVEAVPDVKKTLAELSKTKCKKGLAINPDQPLSRLTPHLADIDLITVMSVFPGFAGQKFIETVLPKVKELAELKKKNNYRYEIEIDGGINEQTAVLAREAGAEILVAGSAVYKAQNPAAMIKALRG
jgi:ribulose-phosphate 3-epimerase